MRQTILKSMVAIGVLDSRRRGLRRLKLLRAAGTPKTATGQPLVIESTPLAPMTDNFNPLSSTSTGFITNSVALYNEPLYIWNYLQPTKPGIPVLASGQPTWSNGGKTLTIPIRSGVKWNDGKPFTASDVAFTFNMIKAHPALYTSGAPIVTSATAPSATSVTLNFAQPQYANLFLIGQVYIEPQHVWSSVGNPVTYTDPSPVGTGPFMLDKFSPQGYTLKQNPFYCNKASVHVPEIDFPSYNTNANLVPPIQSGSIDWAGNYVSDIQGNYLSKSPENHTWLSSAPYFNDNNVVSLFVNTTKAPLNDPAVRQAISYGINRQQLSQQGETGYEPPTSSTSGLMLPVDNSYLPPSQSNDLPAAGDPAKVASILTADGYTKVNGKWSKNGKTIAFKISDPVPYSDYYTDDRPDRAPAQRAGLQRHGGRHRQPDRVGRGRRQRHLRHHDPLVQPGTEPVRLLRRVDGQHAERSGRQAGHRRLRPVQRPGRPVGDSSVRGLLKQHRPGAGDQQAGQHHGHAGPGRPAAVRRRLGRVLHPQLHGVADGQQPLHGSGAEHAVPGVHGSSPEAEVLTR